MSRMIRNQKQIIMLLVGFIVCTVFRTNALSEAPLNSQFMTMTVNAIPIPKENEFQTSEQVIQAFINAVRIYDIDSGMKCFPIRETYTQTTMETAIEQLGWYYAPDAQIPIPNQPLRNLDLAMKNFKSLWNQFMMMGLFSSGWTKITNDKGIKFSEDVRKRTEQLSEVKQMFELSNLQQIEYIGIQKMYDMTQRLSLIDKEMGVVEKQSIEVAIKIWQEEIVATFIVGKIQSNWRILYATTL